MRTELETLQLEFPRYAITTRAIGDKRFYLAEATGSHVQPRFAQADSTDRLRAVTVHPGPKVHHHRAEHPASLGRAAGRERQLRS